ncbi:MBL fold metallo-hydrolase [Streptomonospora nanhaiensis]|uniref:Glyoxylase-like metal-dependent hydrolase (Beta-lactamase superfamily II) n=1 Tax=Streptomonospora nanhaiensis TaxID=1323731 RepID=A0A853BWW8_9ACTN|nr:MBL fold metallo-hydrolase [Streptomonospora nanhaiensis]MBV2363628.1 MBL fold metallo-hydrolase [Streptomonospora nanhaiensis]MBX9390025.1 MBL fold metallo-hydrolase [Streptomonospora nanhaiensis]NYI98672.1 glyoxylase-like metal-dependent hydrolase (beta-lactamase superfamily II) [Streptomonospora nanhaiensis]
MTYSGDTRVGGPADVRELPGLRISKLAVGPMDNNAYLLRCRRTGEGVLIDAADAYRILELIGDQGLARVVTTHRHPDHWGALAEVVGTTGARTVAHPADSADLPVSVDEPVEHGAHIAVGESRLEVVHLRGHTPGSIALRYDDPAGHTHLFTGDSLFPGGVGKTHSPADFASLIDDVEQRVFAAMDDDTWVYPGHGRDTTLGAERPHLGEWRARGW